MGTKQDVYDIEADAEPMSPAEEMTRVISALMDADRWMTAGQAYALGRLWAEVTPLQDAAGQNDATDQETAIAFAVLYQRMMLEFRDRKRSGVLTLDKAWDAFCRSAGGSLDI